MTAAAELAIRLLTLDAALTAPGRTDDTVAAIRAVLDPLSAAGDALAALRGDLLALLIDAAHAERHDVSQAVDRFVASLAVAVSA